MGMRSRGGATESKISRNFWTSEGNEAESDDQIHTAHAFFLVPQRPTSCYSLRCWCILFGSPITLLSNRSLIPIQIIGFLWEIFIFLWCMNQCWLKVYITKSLSSQRFIFFCCGAERQTRMTDRCYYSSTHLCPRKIWREISETV